MKKDKHIIPPCSKCPYKLGVIQTVVNPCPKCKRNGYSTYDVFVNQLSKGGQSGQ